MLNFKLFESSLNRIYHHINNHNCAIITANRKGFSRKKNKKRNEKLRKNLEFYNYSITSAKGVYIEYYKSPMARRIEEDVFFVSNINDDTNFFFNIKKLGFNFDQESVLLIENGNGFLFGTSFDSEFLDFGEKEFIGKFKPGIEGEFMTIINNKPFVFSS